MNTIIFVMMVYSTGAFWIPTLEFSTRGKCETAIDAIVKQTYTNAWFDQRPNYKCVQIEK